MASSCMEVVMTYIMRVYDNENYIGKMEIAERDYVNMIANILISAGYNVSYSYQYEEVMK